MAGDTTAIDERTLRVQWDSYIPMVAICTYWTITKDQLVRLRGVWNLPLRLDRKRRFKPRGDDRWAEPDADEIAASEATLNLAPRIAALVTNVQATWDDLTWSDRQRRKPTAFSLARIELSGQAKEFIDDVNRDSQW